MAKSDNWTYFFSKALGLECAMHKTENKLCIKDTRIIDGKEQNVKVFYDEEELSILEGNKLTPELHMLKNIFGGRIVKYGN
jgi:hypothetical protein